ncbi:Methylamine utilisation protein, MauE [Candidatus Nanopelagicaceae bacterium]
MSKLQFEKVAPWIGLASRLILGGVLLAAGYLKYDALDKSQMAVRAYEMLPIPVANLIGIILPFAEILMGLLLILGAGTRAMGILGALLMLIFVIGISQAWARGLSIDCGCFGGGGQVEPGSASYLPELLRDAGLAALGIYLFLYPQSKFALDKSSTALNNHE